MPGDRSKAFQKDLEGEVYADWDDDEESYGVFGTESGFCYALVCDEDEAEEIAQKINTSLERARKSQGITRI
jgi:hypothetical protein